MLETLTCVFWWGCVCISAGRTGRDGSAGAEVFSFSRAAKRLTREVVLMRAPIRSVRRCRWPHIFANPGFLFHVNPFGGAGMVSLCGFASTFTFLQSIP